MLQIDLHGLSEQEAILKIDAALWELEEGKWSEISFITGNGQVLKDLVKDMAYRAGFVYHSPAYNSGQVIIRN